MSALTLLGSARSQPPDGGRRIFKSHRQVTPPSVKRETRPGHYPTIEHAPTSNLKHRLDGNRS